jgi:hypothetical protein
LKSSRKIHNRDRKPPTFSLRSYLSERNSEAGRSSSGLADKNIISQLFHIICKGSDGDQDETIERLTNVFASRVPQSEFSPAEVLSILLEHRLSAGNAMTNVEAWVNRVRGEKKSKLKREDSWLHNA